MRPTRLVIEGLRSFRTPATIDFGDRNWIAVVGDTGAGKSSILEAMIYALYGQATFSGRSNQLMNDTSDTLRVLLRFRVSGKDWEVARGVTGTKSWAKLVRCGSDGDPIEGSQGVRVVNDRIEKLLGLDSDAFLRTVVLPQGRFARLLVEDKPTERSRILQQVWRTHELEAMGLAAGRRLAEVGKLKVVLQQEESNHPPDPVVHLEELCATAESAASEAKSLSELEGKAREARETLRRCERMVEAASQVTATVKPRELDEIAMRLAPVRRAQKRIDGRRVELDQSEAELNKRLDSIPIDDGPGRTDVAEALATLRVMPRRIDRATDAAAELRRAIADESSAPNARRWDQGENEEGCGALERPPGARTTLGQGRRSSQGTLRGGGALLREVRRCDRAHALGARFAGYTGGGDKEHRCRADHGSWQMESRTHGQQAGETRGDRGAENTTSQRPLHTD